MTSEANGRNTTILNITEKYATDILAFLKLHTMILNRWVQDRKKTRLYTIDTHRRVVLYPHPPLRDQRHICTSRLHAGRDWRISC